LETEIQKSSSRNSFFTFFHIINLLDKTELFGDDGIVAIQQQKIG
jgi:hypothetical protein